MSLLVRSLASGSSGNAFVVCSAGSTVLLDAGLSARTLERRLVQQGIEPASLTAIVLSHEHHDHAQGVGPLARRFGVPVVCTPGTAQALGDVLQGVEVVPLHADGVTVGDVDVWGFPLPHDASDPAGILLKHAAWTVGLALDLGHWQPHMVDALQQADLVVVEANHDRERLIASPYPWSTKRRILSDYGHLSNLQAAELLSAVMQDGRARAAWLAHLSEKANDHPQGVVQAVQNYLDMAGVPIPRLTVAQRDKPSALWHSDHTLQQNDLFAV
jgi:phosphoribosyl 1,2-cyclic phosphodiesterase